MFMYHNILHPIAKTNLVVHMKRFKLFTVLTGLFVSSPVIVRYMEGEK
jgi:hypothetical protein